MLYANDIRALGVRSGHLLAWLLAVLGGKRSPWRGASPIATGQITETDDSSISHQVLYRDGNALDPLTRRDLGLPERSPTPSWTSEFDTWSR